MRVIVGMGRTDFSWGKGRQGNERMRKNEKKATWEVSFWKC